MKQLQQVPIELQWIWATTEGQKYWQNTTRLIAKATSRERREVLKNLKAGHAVVFEEGILCVEAAPMDLFDQQRLQHLKSFEQPGFELSAFHSDVALYGHENQSYYAMREMTERGIFPLAAIAALKTNKAVYDNRGILVDVFVPVGCEPGSFFVDESFHAFKKKNTPELF